MSDGSIETEQRVPRSRVRSIGAAVCLAVAIGFSVAAFAVNASATSPLRAKAQCRINFQASSLHLQIGQDLVLTWVAVGADKLTASWTSGYIPFAGAVTTTMNRAGSFSYQVTGTSNGQYCGGAGVEVNFAGDTPSHAAKTTAPPPSTPSSTANGGGNAGSTGTTNGGSTNGSNNGGTTNGGTTNGGSNNGGTANGDANGGAAANGNANGGGAVGAKHAGKPGAANYPAQSPTGGSGVPWYQQPLNLSGIAALAMLCSLILWKREQVRAPFVHRH
jgi:hypothetical protein